VGCLVCFFLLFWFCFSLFLSPRQIQSGGTLVSKGCFLFCWILLREDQCQSTWMGFQLYWSPWWRNHSLRTVPIILKAAVLILVTFCADTNVLGMGQMQNFLFTFPQIVSIARETQQLSFLKGCSSLSDLSQLSVAKKEMIDAHFFSLILGILVVSQAQMKWGLLLFLVVECISKGLEKHNP